MEKDKICDCLQIIQYQKGDYIIREGEKGNVFYFILDGKCIATQKDRVTYEEKKVYEFRENDYFGNCLKQSS